MFFQSPAVHYTYKPHTYHYHVLIPIPGQYLTHLVEIGNKKLLENLHRVNRYTLVDCLHFKLCFVIFCM